MMEGDCTPGRDGGGCDSYRLSEPVRRTSSPVLQREGREGQVLTQSIAGHTSAA